MKARFDRRWFNPLYFHLRKYVDDPTIRKIMVYGGKSSAKTFTIGQLFLILNYTASASSICYRKEQTRIKTTIKPALSKAIESLHMENVHKEMDFKIHCSTNHHEVVLKGLDTEGKVKGIEGYRFLLFDELDHFSKEEWMQANLSLRGIYNQKLFATWNPIDENIWIKEELDTYTWTDLPLMVDDNPYSQLDQNSFVRLSNDGKVLLIKTTYFDNKWVTGGDGYGMRDDNLIHEYESLKHIDENWYNVNVLGEWGVPNKQGKAVHMFNRTKHVKPTRYNPNHTLWLSFDFNVNPISCTAFQYYEDVVKENHPAVPVIRAVNCFKLDNSNIYKLCDEIKIAYPDALIMITGDATGNNRTAMTHENTTYYTIIQELLDVMWEQFSVPSVNPFVEENLLLVNSVFYHVPVEIDPENCKPLIYDLTYVEINTKKKIIKDRVDDTRKADFLDHLRYFFNVQFVDIRHIPRINEQLSN